MKSREEYKASIFAKRDALLAKRRKRISRIAAASCIALCFITAFAFLPKRITGDFKIYNETESTVSSTAVYTETNEYSQAEKTEVVNYTFYTIYLKPPHTKPHYSEKQIAVTDYAGAVRVTEPAKSPESVLEGEIAAESEDGTKKNFGFYPEWMKDGYEFYEENSITPDSSDGFTEEEITEKAKTYLSDELKSTIIDKHNLVTVSRHADGSEIYTVWFYTDDKQIKVEVDAKNLELIETTVKPLAEPQTSPPYIPTTAAPAYIPE